MWLQLQAITLYKILEAMIEMNVTMHGSHSTVHKYCDTLSDYMYIILLYHGHFDIIISLYFNINYSVC